jgi:hypothetical protein
MSTRAVYSVFEGNESPINIYIHSDGYPSGALDHIKAAFPFAWPLPRFEGDEFAAALCAGNKDGSGNVKIFPSGPPIDVSASDIEYRYEIRCLDNTLWIKCYSTNYWNDKRWEEEIFSGNFKKFETWAKIKH